MQAQSEAQVPSYLGPTSSATIITSHYFIGNVFFNIQSDIFFISPLNGDQQHCPFKDKHIEPQQLQSTHHIPVDDGTQSIDIHVLQ